MHIVNKAYSQKYESCGKLFSGAGELKKHTHDNIHNGENDQNDFKYASCGKLLSDAGDIRTSQFMKATMTSNVNHVIPFMMTKKIIC